MLQVEQSPKVGYKLYNLGTHWKLVSPHNDLYVGKDLDSLITWAVNAYGFEQKEIEIGIAEMEKNFHNAAEYGFMKRFIYTYDITKETLQ